MSLINNQMDIPIPPQAEVLDPGSSGNTGNATLLLGKQTSPCVAKVYRPRRSRIRETMHDISDRYIEGKRGATYRRRHTNERQSLRVWRKYGFAVPRVLTRRKWEDIPWPVTFLEWVNAPLLGDKLRDPTVAMDNKCEWLCKYAQETCRRHEAAIDMNQMLLLQEHPKPNHVFVAKDKLITFDLEYAYADSYPPLLAASQETATFLYEVKRCTASESTELFQSYIQGYANQGLLADLATEFLTGKHVRQRLKRGSDEYRRKGKGKTAVMRQLAQQI